MILKHLWNLNSLSSEQIKGLVEACVVQKRPECSSDQDLKKAVAFIFLENSTRTKISFQRAAQTLGLNSVEIGLEGSSLNKKETLKDTIENLRSFDVKTFVIRSRQENLWNELGSIGGVRFINAGSGTEAHPTQALLDLCSIFSFVKDWDRLKSKKIAILGDLRHSRVAKSWARLAILLNLQVHFYSPKDWKPLSLEFSSLSHSTAWRGSEANYDFVMALRVQEERHAAGDSFNLEAYRQEFQLTRESLTKDCFFMHPGPVNWGVELNKNLKDDPRSLILHQAKMGYLLRTVLLEKIHFS